MKRFLIAAPAYTGDAELIFDTVGKLVRFDITKTNMRPEVLQEFKERVPIHIDNLTAAFEGVKVTITEADFEISFEQFWKKYNKKINKIRCIPLWNKLTKNEQLKAYLGIDIYDRFLRKEGFRTKLDPENYLRNRTWENEYK